jgi:membrane protein implicated in regulation of membrane protease activity
MPDWVIWTIVAAGLAVGEIFTPGLFFLGPVALAAAVAAIAGAVGLPIEIQMAVFVVASIASLAFLRPIARRHMRLAGQLRTGTNALIGQRALVVQRIDAQHGQVKIGGEVWTARPYDDDDVFEPGQRVDVMKIDGATALVAE